MTNFVFDDTIPASNNNPSQDQPDMLANNVAALGIMNVDHIGYNQTNGGLHRQSQYMELAAIPAGLQANFETVYAKVVSGQGELFFTRGNTAANGEFQLTAGPNVNTRFGNNTNYIAPATTLGGWTFLPGGLVMQYGFIKSVNTPGQTPISYPIAFPSGLAAFTVQVTAVVTNSSSDQTASVYQSNGTSTGFIAATSSTGNVTGFNWIAIGK